ncbi:MAG: hypothetical protein ACIAQZ_13020 [Sedimentisphaeraceae bacterium JB056]
MFKMKKNSKYDINGFANKKVADKRSVFDSDFIGREGKLSPRTVKEIVMAASLVGILGVIFYFNFYQNKSKVKSEEELTLADPAVLETINFDTSWSMPEKISDEQENPMLDINKLLEYQRKYANEIEKLNPTFLEEVEKEPQVSFKKIKISVKGILWNPDGDSSALIDREMLKVNQKYKGYTVSKVLRQSVILSDNDGNLIKLNVGEDKEIIATEIVEMN